MRIALMWMGALLFQQLAVGECCGLHLYFGQLRASTVLRQSVETYVIPWCVGLYRGALINLLLGCQTKPAPNGSQLKASHKSGKGDAANAGLLLVQMMLALLLKTTHPPQ